MLLCMILHYILPINITMYEFIIIEWKIYQICKVYNFKSIISCKKRKMYYLHYNTVNFTILFNGYLILLIR